jgi:hypothetical protein
MRPDTISASKMLIEHRAKSSYVSRLTHTDWANEVFLRFATAPLPLPAVDNVLMLPIVKDDVPMLPTVDVLVAIFFSKMRVFKLRN